MWLQFNGVARKRRRCRCRQEIDFKWKFVLGKKSIYVQFWPEKFWEIHWFKRIINWIKLIYNSPNYMGWQAICSQKTIHCDCIYVSFKHNHWKIFKGGKMMKAITSRNLNSYQFGVSKEQSNNCLSNIEILVVDFKGHDSFKSTQSVSTCGFLMNKIQVRIQCTSNIRMSLPTELTSRASSSLCVLENECRHLKLSWFVWRQERQEVRVNFVWFTNVLIQSPVALAFFEAFQLNWTQKFFDSFHCWVRNVETIAYSTCREWTAPVRKAFGEQ